MKRIRFTQRAVFEVNGPNHPDNPVFELESEHTLRNDQADRWLNRKKAELVEDFGPDVLETANAEVVQEIAQAIEIRDGAQFESLADDLAKSRSELNSALGVAAIDA